MKGHKPILSVVLTRSSNIEMYFHPCWPSYILEISIINNAIIFQGAVSYTKLLEM